MMQEYEARIAALERLVGKQALELEFLKGAVRSAGAAEKRAYIHDLRPRGMSVAEGCRLMGIARSTCYDKPALAVDDTGIVEAIAAICDEFEAYGYRRVRAALRHQGVIVNHKKIRRLMREHDLQPRIRRRYVSTTDSDHDGPIFPNRAKAMVLDGPNQLWVSDITYVAITVGFVYVAVILDAWSRRVIGRSIDARLTVAALQVAIERRRPPAGYVHHSDRGSQYAAQAYRALLDAHGLVGSMGRRGNPYDNAKAESFMKTMKVEAVYPMAYETFADVAAGSAALHRRGLQQPAAPFRPRLPEPATVRGPTRPADGQISGLISVHPQGRTPATLRQGCDAGSRRQDGHLPSLRLAAADIRFRDRSKQSLLKVQKATHPIS